MKILYITNDGMVSNLAKKISEDGHQIKFYLKDEKLCDVFDNMVEKTNDWRKELEWVGKEGLIIFDDNGYGKEQEELREQGFSVFGGNVISDKLEFDREFTYQIFQVYGIPTNELITFKSFKNAIKHIKENPNYWTVKREGNNSKFVSYVGTHPEGNDVIEMLTNYSNDQFLKKELFSIQRKAVGVEIGVGRYFNGNNWVGPIEMNIEHPHLFAGDIGPMTEEMGTLAWYTDEENKIYEETLKKLEPFLKQINYKGDFGINTIVNKDGLVALETTARLGSPISHIHTELNNFGWAEFLKAVADAKEFDFKYKKGYCVVISVAVPPFPFHNHFKTEVCGGTTIDVKELSVEELNHVHFDEVYYDLRKQTYTISRNSNGFILYVTGHDENSIKKAREKALSIVKKIHLPKMFYRIDIGERFEREDFQKLKEWGWL